MENTTNSNNVSTDSQNTNSDNRTTLYHLIPGRENVDLESNERIAQWYRDNNMSVPDGLMNGTNEFKLGFMFNNPYNLHYSFDSHGYAWFYADEIANYLGYSRPNNMTRMVPDNLKISLTINNPIVPDIGLDLTNNINEIAYSHSEYANPNMIRQFTIIHEAGVYYIASNSRSERPEIEEFKRRLFCDLLPTVRRYGCYISPEVRSALEANPNIIADLNNKIASLQNTINVNAPFVNTGIACYNSDINVTINQLAKIIQNMLNVEFGEHELRVNLRDDGFLIKGGANRNMPTDLSIDNGLMKIVFSTETNGYITVITPKGLLYFSDYFMDKFHKNTALPVRNK